MSFAARFANIRLSSRELDASLFAPCTPLQHVSPTAYSLFIVVLPSRSERMPPMK